MKRVIITGSTGMVGKGVLLECLDHPEIGKVLVINRSSLEMEHPKLEEILLADFLEIESLRPHLSGYDGCFYCMGISAIGLDEEAYTKITYTTTKAFADLLYALNPEMVFNYVSGLGTDSSERGRMMWARVKGKTENMILNIGFKDAYAFRPGVILPEKGIQSKTSWYNTMYNLTRPLFPWLKKLNSVTSTTILGKAMVNTLYSSTEKKVLENADINRLGKN